MKNIIFNFDEAQELVNGIAQFDSVGMQSIICMLIDTCAAKYKEDATEIADTVRALVHEVNQALGEYKI